MTRNEVHEQIVNCHCRLRKRIHNSTVNKKAKAKKKMWSFDCPPKHSQLPKDTFWISHCAN